VGRSGVAGAQALPDHGPHTRHRLLNAWLAGQGIPSPFGEATRAEDLTFGASDEQVTTTIDVSRWFERKHAAMLAHVSGLGPHSVLVNLPEAVARQLAGREWFVRVRCDAPVREDDLFAGLRERA
jgi:hypothetical protein